MKPKAEDEHDSGLLEYLEDIIGTKHYVEHITKAAGQLEEMGEDRRKHLQLVKVARMHRIVASMWVSRPRRVTQKL
jgi:structural maintenance of chromosome 4